MYLNHHENCKPGMVVSQGSEDKGVLQATCICPCAILWRLVDHPQRHQEQHKMEILILASFPDIETYRPPMRYIVLRLPKTMMQERLLFSMSRMAIPCGTGDLIFSDQTEGRLQSMLVPSCCRRRMTGAQPLGYSRGARSKPGKR
jgi:hypothetical protein